MRIRRVVPVALVVSLVAAPVACDEQNEEGDDGSKAEQKTTASPNDGGKSGERPGAVGSSDEPSGNTADSEDTSGGTTEVDPALLKPEEADEEAPETFRVEFETTSGTIVGEFHREWAPKGADRLYNLVRIGYFEDVAFFRVIDGFMAQFGLHGEPAVNEAWMDASIEDDEVEKSNERGFITFAKRRRPNSRTTQLFINYRDNEELDDKGFAPVGRVVEGMEVVDQLYAGYGEDVSQKKLRNRGNSYLDENFPELDYIESAELVESN